MAAQRRNKKFADCCGVGPCLTHPLNCSECLQRTHSDWYRKCNRYVGYILCNKLWKVCRFWNSPIFLEIVCSKHKEDTFFF